MDFFARQDSARRNTGLLLAYFGIAVILTVLLIYLLPVFGWHAYRLQNPPPDARIKLRQQLVKYSEFPLDEVKDFGFNFEATVPDRKHPYLLFTQADIARARRQAKTVPAMKAIVAEATGYIRRCGGDRLVAKIRETPDGWKKFYVENYVHNGLYDKAPQAYVGSDEEN